VTTVFVTHDQEEAMEIADEIVVMNHGQIEQVGPPAEVYENPATPFVMSFIGAVNVLASDPTWQAHHPQVSQAGAVFLRPHDIEIFTAPIAGGLSAKVLRIIHLGWTIRVELALTSGQSVTAHISHEQLNSLQIQPQQDVFLRLGSVRTFDQADQRSDKHQNISISA
jgi:sulfate/thiosulfate transport system ATP-binding protein